MRPEMSDMNEQLSAAEKRIKALEAEAIRLDEARHNIDLAQKALIEKLETQLQTLKKDLDSEVLDGDRARVSDADIRALCDPQGDESTLELVRSTITRLEAEIEDWKTGSETEAREADKGRRLVAELENRQ